MLLCKCFPVLTLDVLQIAEDPKCVGRLTNAAKSGYFSAVLSLSRSQRLLPLASAQVDRTAATGYIQTSSTNAICWFKASCGSTVGGLLTRSIIAAML